MVDWWLIFLFGRDLEEWGGKKIFFVFFENFLRNDFFLQKWNSKIFFHFFFFAQNFTIAKKKGTIEWFLSRAKSQIPLKLNLFQKEFLKLANSLFELVFAILNRQMAKKNLFIICQNSEIFLYAKITKEGKNWLK